jgi:ACS family glucarate transporter-like MFS transporter
MGFVFGAFTVAYGLFEVPTGRWGDRFGSRGVLTRIVLWWSLFTALTGCVWRFTLDSGYRIGFPGLEAPGLFRVSGIEVPLVVNGFVLLMIVRFLFGAGEAGALPNAARVVARWFPGSSRGPAQGLVVTSAQVGGAVAPSLAAFLIQAAGWRWTFVIFGSLGVVWAIAFYRWFRDDPGEHPAANEAERKLIGGGRLSAPADQPHPPVPWRQVLTSRNMWAMSAIMTCGAFTYYLYITWYPTYLKEGRGVNEITSGRLASLVLAGGAVGGLLGGYLGTWLVRRTGEWRWTRSLLCAGALSLAAGSLLASLTFDSALAATLCIALACLSAQVQLASWWAVTADITGRHLGALFGLMNSMGVPGAAASQLFAGSLADRLETLGYQGRARWDPIFYAYAAALLIGACCWLFVDATKSMVKPPGPGHEGG